MFDISGFGSASLIALDTFSVFQLSPCIVFFLYLLGIEATAFAYCLFCFAPMLRSKPVKACRRQQLLYQLNTSGKYVAFKEQLKYAVVKIVREKYLKTTNFHDNDELQVNSYSVSILYSRAVLSTIMLVSLSCLMLAYM